MKRCTRFFALLILLLILGCGHNPLPPEMKLETEKTSAIAITLDLAVKIDLDFISSRAFDPEVIFFIKVDDSNNLEQMNLIESNFKCESGHNRKDFFLLNLKPGKYAAVAAFGLAKNYNEQNERRNVTVLFPEKMIAASLVEVNEGSISHMGDFHLDTVSSMYSADKLQLYYYAKLTDNPEVSSFWKNLTTNDCYVAPTMNSYQKDKDFEIHQLETLRSCFTDTPWELLIKNRLKAIKGITH